MPLSPGSRLGPYEVLSPLGAGGMGEVYRARDPRLGREVAIKVLPEGATADPERLRRFELEARAAGALSHPNLLAVFDTGQQAGAPFVVFELLEGETLRARLGGGALPPPKALDYAIQMARGLAAAHEKGIVHRDLKPDNLFLTRDGPLKILDFGLAKLRPPFDPGDVNAETRTASVNTGAHTILGTVGYMSPEQVRRSPADHRSDIFSFGCVLYEMLSGSRPFRGGTEPETLTAILNDEPRPLTETAGKVPAPLERIVRHCLEKRPEDRFQSARDLIFDLESVAAAANLPGPSDHSATIRRVRRWSGLAALAVAVAAGWWLLSRRTPGAPPGPHRITPFTTDGGFKEWPKLSPDGEKVAYSWAGPGGDNWDVWVKAAGIGTRPLRLTEHPANDWSPVWSPDGREIAFVRDFVGSGAIYTVPSLGGQERKVTDLTGPGYSASDQGTGSFQPALSWSPDGKWLAFAEKPAESHPVHIVRISLETGQKQPLTSPSDSSWGDFYPSFSPDGTLLAFVRSATGEGTAGNMDVWIQPLETGKARPLTAGSYDICHSPAWTPNGDEIVFTAGGFFAERILRVSLEGGDPHPVAGAGENAASASVQANRMAYLQMTDPSWDVWRLPGRTSRRDRVPEKLIASSQDDYNADYSPDGGKIAFNSNRSGADNIWVCDADGSHPIQLTSFERLSGTPRWSPDGRRIVFDSVEAGDWNLYVIEADGGIPRRLTQEPSDDYKGDWSPDGRWLYFASNRSGHPQIWRMPADGGHAVQVTQGRAVSAEASWDERQLYFVSLENAIWRVPLPAGQETEVLTGPLPYNADWALSRSGIYHATQRTRAFAGLDDSLRARLPTEYAIRFLDFESGEVAELFRKEGPFRHRWLAVSPNEEWILYGEQPLAQAEVMLVENFR